MSLTKKIVIIIAASFAGIMLVFTTYSTINGYIEKFAQNKMQLGREDAIKIMNESILNELDVNGSLALQVKNGEGKFERIILRPDEPVKIKPLVIPPPITKDQNVEQSGADN